MDFPPQFLFGIFQITDFSQDYSWAGGKMYPKNIEI
jgi:hypothetical protein